MAKLYGQPLERRVVMQARSEADPDTSEERLSRAPQRGSRSVGIGWHMSAAGQRPRKLLRPLPALIDNLLDCTRRLVARTDAVRAP